MSYLNSVRVSVTVPVYNTSKYLRKCLDSLAMQTLHDIEFILIDDGSTDDSGTICDEYASRDSRFRVIHQKNGGSAVARQAGLEAARGEYVIVCDSDDWVEPDMYEKLYDKARNSDADMVVCGYFSEYGSGKSVAMQHWMAEADGIVDNEYLLRHGAGSSWVKLIRRELFRRTNACYEPGINMGEDTLIMYRLLNGSPRVVQIRGHYYHYRRLQGESTYTNNVKMGHIHQLAFTYDWLCDAYPDPQYGDIRFQRALDIAFACLRTKDTDKRFLNKFLSEELPWSRLRAHQLSLKSIMVRGEKLLPLPFMKFILKLFYPLIYQ